MRHTKKRLIHILLVDDDQYIRLALKNILSDFGIISEASNVTEAKIKLENGEYDLAIIDLEMDTVRCGLNVLKEAKKKNVYPILLSASQSLELTEEAYLLGCEHFIDKKNFRESILHYVQNYIQLSLDKSLEHFFETEYLTHNQSLKENITNILKRDLRKTNLFISGETGVGKTLIAKKIHEIQSPNTSFIHINCSEFSDSLLESELFGHEKGAFTGAHQAKKGKLELANNGVLFLDEIGTMSLPMQQKLLKVLDDKTFTPVGSNTLKTSNFILISATCESLEDKIKNKEFREDLLYRIQSTKLSIQSLRERKEDIPLLINKFLSSASRRIILKECAREKLSNYSWPGNIRELKNHITNLTLSGKGIFSGEDILLKPNTQNTDFLSQDQKTYIKERGLRDFIKYVEQESIKSSLKRHKGKITASIQELKISSSAFYRIQESLI